jgi:hypothetical protein
VLNRAYRRADWQYKIWILISWMLNLLVLTAGKNETLPVRRVIHIKINKHEKWNARYSTRNIVVAWKRKSWWSEFPIDTVRDPTFESRFKERPSQLRFYVSLRYKAEGREIESRWGWFFNWPNPSTGTMALGSTQPLTQMSNRNLPADKGRPARTADKLLSRQNVGASTSTWAFMAC